MTYQKVKEELVNKRKVISSKDLKKLSINLFLMVLGVACCISLPLMCILGSGFAIISLIACLFIYLQVFNMLCEDEESIGKIRKFVKLWIIPYILFIGIFFTLKYFKFL